MLLWLVPAALAQAAPTLPFEEFTLDNGLHVVLSEDHSVPFVQVNLWYGVGSKDEVPGRKGFAHLFEHLMFQGSVHHDQDYFFPLQAVGGQINGTTSQDRTNYFEGVPAEYLPLALWLEADRMGWLLPPLTEEKLQNQKDVVRNERRQSYENRPYGMVWLWLGEAMYPEGHPYRIPTIGLHEDIEAATLDDVKAFFATWYVPNNATLSVVGDFDPAGAKALVHTYFDAIPAGPEPTPVTEATAELAQEIVVRKTDKVPHDKVWIAWHSPKWFAPGDAELDLVARVLTDGKASRLHERLVIELKLARDVSAWQSSGRLSSEFMISATANPGVSTDEIVRVIDEELAKLTAEGPTKEELAIARNGYERMFYGELATIAGKADALNSYWTALGTPDGFGKNIERYRVSTLDSVHAAIRDTLDPKARVVLHITPAKAEE